ncbi:hypothetical protein AB4114_22160 [Paenibacillus sp. 2RAB27]|uniref:hypothetical protein n=1 Tax=Paenibacillus sp. 2RAB27 TaxID=3232991 RepID=UPI003F9E63B8
MVKRIFSLYLERKMDLQAIVNALTDDGIPPLLKRRKGRTPPPTSVGLPRRLFSPNLLAT